MDGGSRSRPGMPAPKPDADGLSIVVPIYNEASNLSDLHRRLTALAQRLNKERQIAVEVVYVDDGSRDKTVEIARRLPAENFDLQLISFSRNFGKEAALLAGLDHALHGEVLFMDGDGQHPPELAGKPVALWRDEGYDVVYTANTTRAGESASRRLQVRMVY